LTLLPVISNTNALYGGVDEPGRERIAAQRLDAMLAGCRELHIANPLDGRPVRGMSTTL